VPRTPDAFGNVHNRLDHRGMVVFRSPGDYVGRHRADGLVERAPSWWWEKPLKLLARLAGEDV
jgi:hypothetical protein